MAWIACVSLMVAGVPFGGDSGSTQATTAPATESVAAEPATCLFDRMDLSSFAALFPPSDRCFPRFISPISNPCLSKDPRALSQIYPMFLSNWIPSSHPVEGGSFQVYGAGLTVALSETCELGVVKGGYADKHFGNDDDGNGFFNLGLHLKKTLVRDVENQFLLAAGLQWEPQTGSGQVFQDHGDGLVTVFMTAGQEFCELSHFVGTVGFQFPFDDTDNSSFFYTSLHLDRQLRGWIYPILECNWYAYTDGGDRGIAASFGEVDGLVNLGTDGAGGNNLVTIAVGVNMLVSESREFGIVYETPVSHREDFLDHRLYVKYTIKF